MAMAMAMGKLSGLGGAGGGSGGSHASADPQDKIVCRVYRLVPRPRRLTNMVNKPPTPRKEIFDKKHGTGGGAGNQAAKVDGSFIRPLRRPHSHH
jgi:hypothetical protein